MTRRVYIIWTHPLFHDTVSLLLNHPDVQVLGSSTVYVEALEEIEQLKPDTIIIEDSELNGEAQQVKTIMRLLDVSPVAMRIIRISLQDNDLWVYHREQWSINDKEELLHIVSG